MSNSSNAATNSRARERKAVKQHASGDLSTTQLLQTLLRNHNEAAVLSDHLDELRAQADLVSGYSLSSRQTRVDKNVFGFHRTPLRTSLERLGNVDRGSHRDVVVSDVTDRVQHLDDGRK